MGANLRGLIQLPENVDEPLKLWYSYITRSHTHSQLDFTWTTKEYFDSWAKISEDKTTLPGIQVAHIKCIDPGSKAAEVISLLALIPLIVGYSPKTWRRGIDSMIPKKSADLRPEKLRLILLLDARFNHGNKLIGKKMMEYGERHNLLAPEQFGSRKEKSAIDHATNKRFTLDILRQSGTNAIYIANDAKSCYDRIILMVAYLTMRNFGIPPLAAQATVSTIFNMKHYVRTRYGDSKHYYGGDKWNTKPHGCGQGNGYGPALWACISSPLLNILRQEGFGTKIVQPIQNKPIHISAFSFVDDTDIIQTHNSSQESSTPISLQNIDDLFRTTQSALDLWAGILGVTGGALEDSKTYFIPIIHDHWKGKRQTLMKKCNNQLFLARHDGTRSTLDAKNPYDSFFTLGIWQSPSGDDTAQLEHMNAQIRSWGTNTTNNKLTWIQARIASRSTIGRALVYPLSATAFDSSQCKMLQRRFLHEVLGKSGIVRTTPSVLATSPISLGGFGLMSFEIEQLTQHIGLLMQHGPDRQTTTGQLLRSTLEYYALEAGLPGDPLSFPALGYTTKNTWISQTIGSLRQFRIQMKSDTQGLSPWCQDDIFIMQVMYERTKLPELALLNKVRLYLRIVTLSDLLSADGRSYDRRLLTGYRSSSNPHPSFHRYQWPNIPAPTKQERETWT
jgi:Reverse transcriptase (RNA-dependent DNA polymerase).